MNSPVYAGLSIGSDKIALAVRSKTENNVELHSMPLVALRLNGTDHAMFMSRFKTTYVIVGKSSYIIGKDAFNLAGVFPKAEQVRPVINGLINSAEPDSIELLMAFIKKLLDKASVQITDVVFTIPAPSIKGDLDSTYHRNVIEHILEQLNLKNSAVYDVQASAYASLAEENMTGVNVESGYNITSVCFSYLNIPATVFSIPFGTKFLEDAVCRDLKVNVQTARTLIIKYNNGDELPLATTLAVKAGMARFVEEFRDQLESALDSLKDALVTYEAPILVALSGGSFENTVIRESLGGIVAQAIQSRSLNKVRDAVVYPNPRWSSVMGAYILATSEVEASPSEVSSEVLEPLALQEDPGPTAIVEQSIRLPMPSVEEALDIQKESEDTVSETVSEEVIPEKPEVQQQPAAGKPAGKPAKANA